MRYDRIQEVQSILDWMQGEDHGLSKEFHDKIREAQSHLSCCSDNNTLVIAYTRDNLDDVLGRESKDWEWEFVWESIHGDEAWSHMDIATGEAENNLYNHDDFEEDEE